MKRSKDDLFKDMPEHVQRIHAEGKRLKRLESRRLWKEKHSIPVDQSSTGQRFTR